MESAGLLFDESLHYIDHLAPFCALRGWPLFVCEPEVAELCRRFYPGLEVREVGVLELPQVLPEWVVACHPRALLEHALGGLLPLKTRTMWLPHGHSDKGWHTPFFEALERDDLLLVYGERMREVLRAKGVGRPQEVVGNFRLRYYREHRAFYEKLLGEERFILYAPTWDASGTFWEAFEALSKSVSRLAVKLHPNTERAEAARLEACKARHPRVKFVKNFPCIYPLLARADAYIGDMSSIGYDMLAFDKPLFFLVREAMSLSDPSAFLMRCGEQVLISEVGSILQRMESDARSQERVQLLAHTFH